MSQENGTLFQPVVIQGVYDDRVRWRTFRNVMGAAIGKEVLSPRTNEHQAWVKPVAGNH
jgi:hypothetical protein